jgi:transcriptional regulator with XRE-family HTH domain
VNLGDIGTYIRERRRVLGITLKDLAELSGIGINTLNKIELGQANPTFRILMELFDVLGLEMSLSPKRTDVMKGPES